MAILRQWPMPLYRSKRSNFFLSPDQRDLYLLALLDSLLPCANKAGMSKTPYDALGGEPMVRRLCARFYELMDSLPQAKATRAAHPPSLANAEEKLYEYLTGWLGGPPLYTDKYGHPRLRMRHFVAPIGREEIEGWLLCFHQAWSEIVPPSPLASTILEKIDALGWHMANKDLD